MVVKFLNSTVQDRSRQDCYISNLIPINDFLTIFTSSWSYTNFRDLLPISNTQLDPSWFSSWPVTPAGPFAGWLGGVDEVPDAMLESGRRVLETVSPVLTRLPPEFVVVGSVQKPREVKWKVIYPGCCGGAIVLIFVCRKKDVTFGIQIEWKAGVKERKIDEFLYLVFDLLLLIIFVSHFRLE